MKRMIGGIIGAVIGFFAVPFVASLFLAQVSYELVLPYVFVAMIVGAWLGARLMRSRVPEPPR